jgi:hypothetical protein
MTDSDLPTLTAIKVYKEIKEFMEEVECGMSVKKCLECSFSEISSTFTLGITEPIIIPCKLICKVTGETIEVTKCIKEA